MVRTEAISYTVDGIDMVGHLAVDDAARITRSSRPGVLVAHEGGGLDANARDRAERLAAAGYVAFALDYLGGGTEHPFAEAQARLGELIEDPIATRRIARAGLDVLTVQPQVDQHRLAAIGFCFGGTMSLELARDGAPLRAIVGFHPGLYSKRPEDSKRITGCVLMCCGAEDPITPPDARLAFEDEMRAAAVKDWRVELYGGVGHSFTNPSIDQRGWPGFGYDQDADRRSWQSMLNLLADTLGPDGSIDGAS